MQTTIYHMLQYGDTHCGVITSLENTSNTLFKWFSANL